MEYISRRHFLKLAGTTGAMALFGTTLTGCSDIYFEQEKVSASQLDKCKIYLSNSNNRAIIVKNGAQKGDGFFVGYHGTVYQLKIYGDDSMVFKEVYSDDGLSSTSFGPTSDPGKNALYHFSQKNHYHYYDEALPQVQQYVGVQKYYTSEEILSTLEKIEKEQTNTMKKTR